MESASGPNATRPAAPGAPRQRWRLYVVQPAATESERRVEGGVRSWPALLAASGLPLALEGARGRVVPAAPLPLGIAGEREVVDVYLAERRTAASVREAVASTLPAGWSLVELHDVWIGAQAAPAAVVAADYRVEVAGPPLAAVEAAAAALLAARSLPRERRREKRTTAYDLRPLLLHLEIRGGGSVPATLAMRLRHDQDAVGRPEEVLAALAEPPAPPLGAPLAVVAIVRERLVMLDDPDAPPAR